MFGFMNSDKEWFDINDKDKKTDYLKNEYSIMQYYRIFGKKEEQ